MKTSAGTALPTFLLLAVAAFGAGCGKIDVPASMNLDPNKTNTLTIELDAPLEPVVIPLVGGINGRIAVDTSKILTRAGLFATIVADEVRIAGESVPLFDGSIESGTLCAREDAEDPTVAYTTIRYPHGNTADVHFAVEATNELLAEVDPPGIFPLSADASGIPLRLNFFRLLRFQLEGSVRASNVVVAGVLPVDMALLGGLPFQLDLNLTSSWHPASEPLLEECASFFQAN